METLLHSVDRPPLETAIIEQKLSYWNPSGWKGRLIRNRQTLEKIQKCLADFVTRSIGQIQRSTRTDNTTVRDSILRRANKLRLRFRLVSDRTTSLMKGELFRDLMGLYRGDCWNRIIRCPKCNKFFVAKTVRPQRFCSDECRWNYHNKEKRATGAHTQYMRKYLPDYRKRKSQT